MALIINGIEKIETTHVPQVAVTTLSLTGGTAADVFTIAGSPIEVLGLFMHVTTAVSANACTFKWQLDPTSGASSTDLCGALDIQSAAIGDVFYILGPSASALQLAANGTAVALSCTARAFLLPGGIDAVLQNSDPTSGFATVYLIYRRMTLAGFVT